MGSYGKDEDWRSQLDSKYSESLEFQEILSQYTDEKHMDPMAGFPHSGPHDLDPSAPLHKSYPAIRFPQVAKVDLPTSLDPKLFLKDMSAADLAAERKSIHFDDIIAGIKFLEAMLKTIYDKVSEIRESVIENGGYLYCLDKPLMGEDINNINAVVLDNLILMRDDSMHLIEEILIFSADKMNDIIRLEDSHASPLLADLRADLITRGQLLQNEAATSLLSIDQLTEYAYSLVHYPTGPYCAADGLAVCFDQQIAFYQAKVRTSAACLAYLAYMGSRSYPICESIFTYLQSPEEHDHRLWIVDHAMRKGEWTEFLSFLALQDKRSLSPSIADSLQDLSLCACSIGDSECSALARQLLLFPNLRSLRLSNNKITYSGIASLATHIFEHGSDLQSLYLDHNRINREGAGLLGQILPRMRRLAVLSVAYNPIRDTGAGHLLKHCLNPYRRAFRTFPKINAAESTAYSLFRRSLRTAESDSLLGELDEQVEEEVPPEEEEEEEEEVRTGRSSLVSRYPRKCYFDDYFFEAARPAQGNSRASTHAAPTLLQYQWVNNDYEEFDMDVQSDYSDNEEAPADTESRARTRSRSGSQFQALLEGSKEHQSWAQAVGSQRVQQQARYPLIIRKLIKLRLRLAAVSMFQQLRMRGHPALSCLMVNHCSLTPAVLPAVKHALSDNHTLTSIDLSGHPFLMASTAHCEIFADMLMASRLGHLGLNNVGLKDSGLLALQKAIASSSSLKDLQLSGNAIGPTGANVVANLAKTFFCDMLSIHRQKIKLAPLLKPRDGLEAAQWDTDDISLLTGAQETKTATRSRASVSTAVDVDDENSFVDHDMFDGEESEDDDEAEEDEAELPAIKEEASPARSRSLFGWKSKGKKTQ